VAEGRCQTIHQPAFAEQMTKVVLGQDLDMEDVPNGLDGGLNEDLECTVIGLEQCGEHRQSTTCNEHVQHQRIAATHLVQVWCVEEVR